MVHPSSLFSQVLQVISRPAFQQACARAAQRQVQQRCAEATDLKPGASCNRVPGVVTPAVGPVSALRMRYTPRVGSRGRALNASGQ